MSRLLLLQGAWHCKTLYTCILRCWLVNEKHIIIFVQTLRLCLSANQYTLCSLQMKGQTPKRQAVKRLRIYSSLIRFAIWFGRALSPGTKVTTSFNSRASFNTLIFSQPVFTLFAADNGTNPETSVRTANESIYVYIKIYT